MEQLKQHPEIGVCGLDCGLCPRHYANGPSRCPGCGGPDFADKHPSCSFITCCVKRKGLEVCGQCGEFPCAKFKSEEEYRQVPLSSSYPPYRVTFANLEFIRREGTGKFAARQGAKISLLATMIRAYDDGRSRSFFCRAAALLEPEEVERALEEAGRVPVPADGRKAETLKRLLTEAARRRGIELRTGK